MNVFVRLAVDARDGLTRIVEPFNNRATSAGGVGLITTATIALAKNLTDATWLQDLWLAMHGSGAAAADKTPIFQLVAIGFGFVLGAIGLYVGAPWFVKPDPPPDRSQPAAAATLKPAA